MRQLATRSDLAEVRSDVADAIGSLRVEMTRLHGESLAAMAGLETRMTEKLGETRVELIRWFLGSLIAMAGVVATIFRLMGHN